MNSEAESMDTKEPILLHHRHLQSETYRTLLRIISLCNDHPHLCQTPQLVVTQQLTPPDDDGNEPSPRQPTADEVGEHVESAVNNHSINDENSLAHKDMDVDGNFETNGLQDRGLSDAQLLMNEIENIMRIEEDVDLLEHKNLIIGDGTNGIQDGDLGQVQLLIDELEHVIKGNEIAVHDNNCNLASTSLDKNQSGGGLIAFSINEGEYFHPEPIVTEESMAVGQDQVEEEFFGQTISTLKPIDNAKDKISLSRADEFEGNREMLPKEGYLEKSACISGVMSSTNHQDGEMEEGEITGELGIDDRVVNIISEDVMTLEDKKAQETKFHENVINKHGLPSNGINELKDTNNSRELEIRESARNWLERRRQVVVYEDPILDDGSRDKEKMEGPGIKGQKESSRVKLQKKCSVANQQKKGSVVTKDGIDKLALQKGRFDQNETRSQVLTSKEKEIASLQNEKKRKRSPPSEEKKAKKKEKKRKKRAEKNRELGVKRLKLRPVLKPKPVTYCRHFLKGRCQEGEKCKFSHDTIPLTKSKPCCHFARQSCMKGNDCPFDHQLSKYPCSSYVSKGYCVRGEDCLFSHKLLPKEDAPSASNVCTPDLKTPRISGDSSSKKLLDFSRTPHQAVNALPDSLGVISSTKTEQNMAKCVPNLPALVPKGISFLSTGKSPTVELSHPKLATSSMKRNEGMKVGNQTDQGASSTVQILNEKSKESPPLVAPKGINFLSFGKSSSDNSDAKKLTSWPISPSKGVKLSLSNNFSGHKPASLSSNVNNSIHADKEATQTVSNTQLRLNEVPLKTDLSVSPLKPSFLSLREASTDGSRNSTPGSLPSSSGSGFGSSLQASKTDSDKYQCLNVNPWKLLASPIGSGQSSSQLTNKHLNTSNSAQKSLMSTLAFAAKIGSEMKMNQSRIGAFAGSSGVNKDSGTSSSFSGSRNDSTTSSKILDFLSTIGGKTKQ